MTTVDTVRDAVLERMFRAAVWSLRKRGDLGAELFGRGVRRDPYPVYDRIRSAAPVVPSRFNWMTAHHELVESVLRDPRFGHGEPQAPPFASLLQVERDPSLVDPVGPESMIGMDPPDHTRLRRLVSKAFTPRSIEALRPRVRAIAGELLDAVDDELDFMDVAGVLPILVICEVLGVPATDRALFRRLGRAMTPALDVSLNRAGHRRATDALTELQAYLERLFDQRRRDPGDDLLSALLAVEEGGDTLQPRELMATALLLLLAGFETTVNLLGNGLLALLSDREQLELLRAQPDLVSNAVEEFLRYDSPVQLTARAALSDVELGGQPLHRGALVVVLIGGANHDPAVFDQPDRLDVTRPNARRQLAFAAGPHHCLGAALARLEGEVVFSTLLERFASIELAGDPQRRPTFLLRGLERLPLRVRAAEPARH